MSALAAANGGHEIAYGEDSTTEALAALVCETFGPEARIFPVFNGTAANVLGLQALLPPWGAVVCAESAHVHADEGGAPEKVAGIKLWPVPTRDGKLAPEALLAQLFDRDSVHRAQPCVVTIANTTELGTVYTPAEVRALADAAHGAGLLLHMDGARIFNAAAALGASLRAFTTDAGVDVLSLGGTKVGAMGAEAVVVLRGGVGGAPPAPCAGGATLTAALPFLRKSAMQLASKQRFISAQLVALLGGGLGLRLGAAANSRAERLEAGLRALGSARLALPNARQANAVFPVLPKRVIDGLLKTFRFYVWNEAAGMVRLMCSWDTSEQQVDALVEEVARLLALEEQGGSGA
jgi:threonine aldolase